MWKTTYTPTLIRLNSNTITKWAIYPDYNNPFMPDSNRYKNIVMPFWFTDLWINRAEAILYNDDINRATDIVITLSIVRSWVTTVLYTFTFVPWVSNSVSTTAKWLKANDKLFITIVDAPWSCLSAVEIFLNYSNKETAWQFSNNISIWFDQSLPKFPAWVIKELTWCRDDVALCLPSVGTNNSWLYSVVWSDAIIPQLNDVQRNIRMMVSTTDRIADKISVSLTCWWSTGIWWTGLTAPSANISCVLPVNESWTNYLYIASRWLAANSSTWNDTFRLQKYSYNTSTKVLAFSSRSTAYRTMKTWRSWGWIFSLRTANTTGSFANKIIAWTMLRQQAATDSKIWWLTLYSTASALTNTFQRIGNTDASLIGVSWPWFINEEVTAWVSTITCMWVISDTSVSYSDSIAQIWKYDNTWAITSQSILKWPSVGTALYNNRWITQYLDHAFVFGEFYPDPVWTPTVRRPYIIELDKDWNYINEYITYANESSDILSLYVDANYLTFVLKNISDWKSVVSRYNRSTFAVDYSFNITWMNVYFAQTLSYNKIFIHWYSTVNQWSSYGYIYIPYITGSTRQSSNNFTIGQQVISSSPNYLVWYYWTWFTTTTSTTPTYTQALTTQTLSWWWTAWTVTNNIFYSSL